MTTENTRPQALVIINPVAGYVNDKAMKKIISDHFKKAGWTIHIYFTEKGMELAELVRIYAGKGIKLVVVAGGDGTVASAAAGLVNTDIPLGIIPAGTWNAIARYLLIPTIPAWALTLMTGKHHVRHLDLMAIGDTYHAMNLGAGISARMIKSSSRDQKRKVGNLSYYTSWIRQLFGLELMRYTIEADGKKYRGRALEIMVANYGVVGLNLIESPLEIHPDDGKVDVLIFKPKTILDLPAMFWQALVRKEKQNQKFQQLQACSSIMIQSTPPMDVQADGEIVGQTPVSVTVLPRCVAVIVP